MSGGCYGGTVRVRYEQQSPIAVVLFCNIDGYCGECFYKTTCRDFLQILAQIFFITDFVFWHRFSHRCTVNVPVVKGKLFPAIRAKVSSQGEGWMDGPGREVKSGLYVDFMVPKFSSC